MKMDIFINRSSLALFRGKWQSWITLPCFALQSTTLAVKVRDACGFFAYEEQGDNFH